MASYSVDVSRLQEIPTLASVDPVVLEHIGNATCDAVENYCRRQFGLQSYDELYHGTGGASLFLNQYPVQSVSGIRYGRMFALQIVNNTRLPQAATVEITDDALVLTFTNNNQTTPTTLTWAVHPTIADLSDAVNALGNEWQCTLSPSFATWQSSDLKIYKTTQSARNVQAVIDPHYFWQSQYRINANLGEIVRNSGWMGGYQAYRVTYTAGYASIPDELIQATCEWASATYLAAKSDPNLQSENLGVYSYTRPAFLAKSINDLSVASRQTLNYYRKPIVPFYKA